MRKYVILFLISCLGLSVQAQSKIQYGFSVQPAVSVYHDPSAVKFITPTLNGGFELVSNFSRFQFKTGIQYYANQWNFRDFERFTDHRIGLPLILGIPLTRDNKKLSFDVGLAPSYSINRERFGGRAPIINTDFSNSNNVKPIPTFTSPKFQSPLVLGLTYNIQLKDNLTLALQPRAMMQLFGSDRNNTTFVDQTFSNFGLNTSLLFNCNRK